MLVFFVCEFSVVIIIVMVILNVDNYFYFRDDEIIV